jgi:GNAT superfamily N-acetyltransferase
MLRHVDEARLDRSIAAACGQVTPLRAEELVGLPEALRKELEAPAERDAVLCVRSGGVAACFAYASAQTESLFDISIETLEPYRRRGYASLAAAALIERERRTGRSPVWSAYDDNPGSLALAAALGFAPDGHIFVTEIPWSGQGCFDSRSTYG